MECFKCSKEMDRKDGGPTIQGIVVTVKPGADGGHSISEEDIKYNNLQLGKYSLGTGACDVAICYECYIDGLFHLGK